MGLVRRSSVVAAAICTAGWSSRNKRSTRPTSCGVAATERKCAHSSRFHHRADRLLVRTTRVHHWLANTRDRSCHRSPGTRADHVTSASTASDTGRRARARSTRSEEHTSELQSQSNLVCRLLLEKKKRLHLVFRLLLE